MKKSLPFEKKFACLILLLAIGFANNVFAQTYRKLLIESEGGNAWTTGTKDTYTYSSGDVINYLNGVATDGTDITTFSFSPFLASLSTSQICRDAVRRVQVNSFDLVLNSTSLRSLLISGTSSGTAVRTIRAIYVNGNLLSPETYSALHTFPTDGTNTSATCGDIVVGGLDVPQGATVRVVIGSSITSTPQNLRVSVIYLNDPVLPVHLLNFDALRKGSAVEVTWKAVNETEGKTYNIQRSANGSDFQTISSMPVSGAGNYSYVDQSPKQSRLVYYRLEMKSVDGITSYSKIKAVDMDGENQLLIAPNPARGNTMLATFAPVTEPSTARIVNPSGVVLKNQAIPAFTDQATIYTNGIQQGVYMLQIISGKEIQTIRFVKQ